MTRRLRPGRVSGVKYWPLEDFVMPAPRWFHTTFRATALAGLVAGGVTVLAQSGSGWVMPADAPENAALKNLHWRSIGPANPGGRITVVTGIPGKPDVFYVA